ncbi:MAG TPA: 3'-5' exonuclease [Paenalcaligenes hominis]|mgnify:FL=1|uniref:3'-5' exonuclease n=1 Tax=Paenalcaligenes hominis TaxID=643674 RepID=A0A9D2VFL7_9BURK|nr:3'-5' exonuclease [Paenalcaligenes hominis]NJB65258.1 DNA polymerase-3 subunit epsilon [Paenalcaligenes hominis]GGE72189.1 hypothetical protein GCM10007278_20560 [Paenalcaligenes hominis]HJH23953.1 3'-5' exonuclease [Paenalcaligenes hominis]
MHCSWWQFLKRYYTAFQSQRTGFHPDRYAQQVLNQAAPLIPADQPLGHPAMVFDLETTGLDTRTDTVISIGAVRLTEQGIALGNSFYQVLDIQVDLQGESQLIHGLTQKDLDKGCDPRQALFDFFHYSQNHIWLAFHAEFDRRMLKNAVLQHLGLIIDPQPIDIAYLAPLLFPELATSHSNLDDWLQVFNLPILARHNAAADALATAELLMILINKAQQLGFKTWGELQNACLQQRQIQRFLS